jgi:hypothetical protein
MIRPECVDSDKKNVEAAGTADPRQNRGVADGDRAQFLRTLSPLSLRVGAETQEQVTRPVGTGREVNLDIDPLLPPTSERAPL